MSLRSTYEEYDYKKVEKKSEEFLKTIMGDEKFDKLKKNGKIEIEIADKSGKTIYELYSDGRLINRTKNQNYCVVTDRSDYPVNDLVAIKYAWLVHRNEITEKVANKTSLLAGTANTPAYEEYVHYLESNGWQREQLIIDQYNANIVTACDVGKDTTHQVVDIRCPAGMKISIIGRRHIHHDAEDIAYSMGLFITDDNGEEIPDGTKIRIVKDKPSDIIIQLARIYYQDIKMTRGGEDAYRFHNGIELNGDEYLRVYVIDCPKNIRGAAVKFKMEADLWTR